MYEWFHFHLIEVASKNHLENQLYILSNKALLSSDEKFFPITQNIVQ